MAPLFFRGNGLGMGEYDGISPTYDVQGKERLRSRSPGRQRRHHLDGGMQAQDGSALKKGDDGGFAHRHLQPNGLRARELVSNLQGRRGLRT